MGKLGTTAVARSGSVSLAESPLFAAYTAASTESYLRCLQFIHVHSRLRRASSAEADHWRVKTIAEGAKCPIIYEMISKRIYAAWFVVHFFLITAVCFAGIFSLVAEGATILPSALEKYARKAELISAFVLGKEAAASSPVRQGIATYLHAAGIQAGYSFFAPNVPGYHKLTLELYYEDGRVEYESPHVSGRAATLRLESLLNRLGDQRYEPLREVVVKMLALSIWREHPDVKKIRAIFGAVNPPSINDFEHGKGESFQPMFSFNFSLREEEKR